MSSSTEAPKVFAWDTHAATCARCGTVLLSQPATFGRTCLAGAALLKDALSELHGRGREGRAP